MVFGAEFTDIFIFDLEIVLPRREKVSNLRWTTQEKKNYCQCPNNNIIRLNAVKLMTKKGNTFAKNSKFFLFGRKFVIGSVPGE